MKLFPSTASNKSEHTMKHHVRDKPHRATIYHWVGLRTYRFFRYTPTSDYTLETGRRDLCQQHPSYDVVTAYTHTCKTPSIYFEVNGARVVIYQNSIIFGMADTKQGSGEMNGLIGKHCIWTDYINYFGQTVVR